MDILRLNELKVPARIPESTLCFDDLGDEAGSVHVNRDESPNPFLSQTVLPNADISSSHLTIQHKTQRSNSRMPRPKVIAITGMPGAGKTLVSRFAQLHGVPVLACGDVIREEAVRRGLQPTPSNMAEVMLTIRQREGPGVVAERLIPKIESSGSPVIIVDGVRSLEEVTVLQNHSSVTIVGVHASPRTRYERLRARERSDDPKNWAEFQERDLRELRVGIGDVISLADKMLINEFEEKDLEAVSESMLTEMMQE